MVPRAEDEGFDLALVLAGRHRGLNELRIAEALERVGEGGLVVVAGGKDDGIASLRKRLGGMVEIDGPSAEVSRRGVLVPSRRQADAAAAATLRADNPDMLVEGRFHTAPGMFSYDRVDAGSRLLVEHLPNDIKGAVADFCAGWGYVAAEVAARAPQASRRSISSRPISSRWRRPRRNVRRTAVEPRFFWAISPRSRWSGATTWSS